MRTYDENAHSKRLTGFNPLLVSIRQIGQFFGREPSRNPCPHSLTLKEEISLWVPRKLRVDAFEQVQHAYFVFVPHN